MHCLLVYDITDDRIRAKVADICLDYGLSRIQYSAFLGNLSGNHQQELLLKLKRRLGKAEGNIQLFPLCEKDIRLRKQVGNGKAAGGDAGTRGRGDGETREEAAE